MNRGNGLTAAIGIVIGMVIGVLAQDLLLAVASVVIGGMVGWLLDFVFYILSGNMAIDQRILRVTRR